MTGEALFNVWESDIGCVEYSYLKLKEKYHANVEKYHTQNDHEIDYARYRGTPTTRLRCQSGVMLCGTVAHTWAITVSGD